MRDCVVCASRGVKVYDATICDFLRVGCVYRYIPISCGYILARIIAKGSFGDCWFSRFTSGRCTSAIVEIRYRRRQPDINVVAR